MIQVDLDIRDLTSTANRLAVARAQLGDLLARRADILTRGPLLRVARAEAPVLTGALRDSLRPLPAVPVGPGLLESTVVAGVSYADEVVASQPRGRRDYPYATELATRPEVQAAADDMARAIVDVLEGL